MRFSITSIDEVIQAIQLDTQFTSSSHAALIAASSEHIRAQLAMEAADSQNLDRYPTPTIRITQPLVSKQSQLSNFLHAETSHSIIEELSHLETIGDLVRSDGRWYVSPQRLIPIDDANFLLVGGGSLQTLPFAIRKETQVVGRARLLIMNERNYSVIAQLPQQSLEDWLGPPAKNIETWAHAFQKAHLKVCIPPEEIKDYFVFDAPWWIPIDQYRGGTGTVLIREVVSINSYKKFLYSVGKIVSSPEHPPKVIGTSTIEKNEARRFQCALQAVKRPSYFAYKREGALLRVKIPHPLPHPESRVLSLGWNPAEIESSKKWPRDFCFASKLLPIIQQSFRYLGYSLKERGAS